MKTEDLIREYIRTHKLDAKDATRARIEKAAKPTRPITPRGK